MTDLTVYNLMAEDMIIWAKLVDSKNIHVEIKDEQDAIVYSEKSNIAAWEGLVYFAKQVIAADKRMQTELENLDD